ncbi:glutamyl-Q tRNA(Asp) synthetase [compost metagenome]
MRYLHVPLILDAASGLKLSKQNGAPAIDTQAPRAALQGAWGALGFAPLAAGAAADPGPFLREATAHWARRFPLP